MAAVSDALLELDEAAATDAGEAEAQRALAEAIDSEVTAHSLARLEGAAESDDASDEDGDDEDEDDGVEVVYVP